MDQRISLITLGVSDLERAVGFYEALGWSVANDWRTQDVAFFQCVGMVVALWDRQALADDSATAASVPGATTLAFNARTREEVDSVLAEAAAAGATVPRGAAETFWGGYSGIFHDPDGHAWEIAHNPSWRIDELGATHIE